MKSSEHTIVINKTIIAEQNAAGKYYITDNCIFCTICSETLPVIFASNYLDGYSYLHRQPSTQDEEQKCREAMQRCPVNAIRDDGVK